MILRIIWTQALEIGQLMKKKRLLWMLLEEIFRKKG
jgi:hypothetical protein